MIQNPIVTIAQKYYTNGAKQVAPSDYSDTQISLAINEATLSTEDYNKFISDRLSRQWYELAKSDEVTITPEIVEKFKATFNIIREHAPIVYKYIAERYKIYTDTDENLERFIIQDYAGRSETFNALFPKELYGTKYRRCNSKVFEFINSIDLPDEQLANIYLNDLADRADKSPNEIYSEMYHVSTKTGKGILRVVVNGYGTTFIDYIHDHFVDGQNQMSLVLPGGDRGRIQEENWLNDTFNEEVITTKSKLFGFNHPLAFLINIYLAEKTGSIVKAEEPKEEKREVELLASRGPKDKKPKEVCYEYVKVTDEAWTQYEVSERIRREGGPRGEYVRRKSFWWTKAHYRKQNYKNGISKILFINGHYCHSRTTVREIPIVEVLV